MIRYLAPLVASLAMTGPAVAQIAPACPATPAAFRVLRERVIHPPAGHVVVVAHRACFSAAPENTPEAIEACWRMGVEVVENDVRRTADGELVVVHDDTIDRMTDAWGYVDDLTMAEIGRAWMRERDGGPGAYVTDIRVPTFRAYLEASRNKVMINLELKASGTATYESLYAQAMQIAREVGVVDHLILKVPDKRAHGRRARGHILDTLEVAPDLLLMPIIWGGETPVAERLDELERHRPIGYEVPFNDPAYLGQAGREPRLAGRPIMAVAVQPYWSGGLDDRISMNEPDVGWGRLVALGANLLMTDRPEALLSWLNRTGRRSATGECG